MHITKLGHCCLVLKVDGVTILTDPGSFTTAQNSLTGIDCVLITHEHQDHFHIESLKAVLANNPTAIVVSNKAVAKLIEEQIADTVVTIAGDGQSTMIKDVLIEGFGTEHARVYDDMGKCENTGYMVAHKFYFPGDNFHLPAQAGSSRTVDVLALPTAGPWMKLAEAVDFAKLIKARVAFGVHDGMIEPGFRGFVGNALKMFAPETEYVSLADGESREF